MVKTVILCGGRGSRLRPLTDEIPKALVTLNNKPLLQHLIESYIRKGIRSFVLCVGYRGKMIEEFVEHHPSDAEFEISDAGEEASILQRLHVAGDLTGERFFVAYGDTLIDVGLEQMLEDHVSSGALATVTTADVRSPFGLVTIDSEGWARSFEEKPVQLYYVGHMLLERSILDDLDPGLLALPDGDGLVRLFGELISRRRLNTYAYNGPQITFNTEQELHQAERDFITFFTHREEALWQ